jgi:hypothetical protein
MRVANRQHQVETLLASTPEGLTVPEIAARLGCNPTSARRICKASAKIYLDRWQPVPFRNRRKPTEQVQLVPVWCWTAHPVEDAPPIEVVHKKDDIIAALAAHPDGITVAQLSALCGVSNSVAWHALRTDPRIIIDRWVSIPPSPTNRRPRHYWAAVVAVSSDPAAQDAPHPDCSPSRRYAA